MALCIRGATAHERQVLVEAMRDSGACWRLRDVRPGVVDKHSTGGVGDTVSLIFAPLVAACGSQVAMMAGAGLGHTQGTLDKLASIPGFAVARGRNEALDRIDRCGVCFAAQSEEIAPADRKLYALRDVTATVPSLPLIVASIMSKKLAVGAPRLVLDVKSGSGAFCKTGEQAEELAAALVDVAAAAGVAVRALITDMNEPLGRFLGTANEVRAAVDALEGRGDPRLTAVTLELAIEALLLDGFEEGVARSRLVRALEDGSARRKLDEVVVAHGGTTDFSQLARPRRTITVTAPRAGFVGAVAAEELGWMAVSLGAGRRRQSDEVDARAGVEIHARVGDEVRAGQPLVTLEVGNRDLGTDSLPARALGAFTLTETRPLAAALVSKRLGRRS
jgi:pyrimidine-nucleoside phosphorylase